MGCGFKIQDALLQLPPSYGSKVCYDAVNSDVSAFRNRIIGIDHAIESIPDRGHQLGFLEIDNVSVSYLTGLIRHDHLVYRTRITLRRSLLLRTGGFDLVTGVVLERLRKEMLFDAQRQSVFLGAPFQGTSSV